MDRAPSHLSTAMDTHDSHDMSADNLVARLRTELAHAHAQAAQSRQQAEERQARLVKLQSAHQLLVSTLDATNDGVVVFGQNDASVYYNIRFVEMWGLPEERLGELTGDGVVEIMKSRVADPEDFHRRVEEQRNAPDTEHFSIVELQDGRVFERHVTPQRLRGRNVGSVVTFRDVTERIRYEEKMMLNQHVLENSGPMLWVDRETKAVTYANAAACRHLGYEAPELLQMKLPDLDPCYGSDHSQEVLAALDDGSPVTLKSKHRRSDGDVRDVEVTMFLTEESHRPMYIASVKDITEESARSRLPDISSPNRC